MSLTRITACLFSLVFLFGAGCSKYEELTGSLDEIAAQCKPSGVKILLIGIDGGTFSIIKPMIEKGRLPRFKSLIENGAHGVLKSEKPMLSPAIWTTIVTGRDREDHGVEDFVVRSDEDRRSDEDPLVGSNDRRVAALWNWISLFEKTVGFQGWWASWPAEPVKGWIISDRVIRSRWTEWTGDVSARKLTYPDKLIEEIKPLIIDPAEPPMDELKRLVRFSKEELEEFGELEVPIYGHAFSVLKFAYCAQRTYERTALHMLEREQPALTGVFLIANDAICHTFWHFYKPEDFDGIDSEKAARFGPLIPDFYEHNDRYLSKLLDKVDEDTVVIIVSDHGFQSSGKLPQEKSIGEFDYLDAERMNDDKVTVGQSGCHQMDGIFIACGPPIRKGAVVKADIYDVAPTILALMGLPVSGEMEGDVLTEIIDPAYLEKHPVRQVRSFEDYLERIEIAVDQEADEEAIKRQLQALGYL